MALALDIHRVQAAAGNPSMRAVVTTRGKRLSKRRNDDLCVKCVASTACAVLSLAGCGLGWRVLWSLPYGPSSSRPLPPLSPLKQTKRRGEDTKKIISLSFSSRVLFSFRVFFFLAHPPFFLQKKANTRQVSFAVNSVSLFFWKKISTLLASLALELYLGPISLNLPLPHCPLSLSLGFLKYDNDC